jgi:hypothetical protein
MTQRRPTPLRALAVAVIATGLLAGAPTAYADDRPSPEERSRIEASLRQLGFVSWGEIEREDNGRRWEVDDARMPDGTKYDLELAADDLSVVKRERN